MKRWFAVLLVILSLFSLAGCNGFSIKYDDAATLNFHGLNDDPTEVVQLLTEEETRKVKDYLSDAKYDPNIGPGGCYFKESIFISFGEQVFWVSLDDCPTIWYQGNRNGYVLSEEGKDYIDSLFEKYVGYFPFPENESVK